MAAAVGGSRLHGNAGASAHARTAGFGAAGAVEAGGIVERESLVPAAASAWPLPEPGRQVPSTYGRGPVVLVPAAPAPPAHGDGPARLPPSGPRRRGVPTAAAAAESPPATEKVLGGGLEGAIERALQGLSDGGGAAVLVAQPLTLGRKGVGVEADQRGRNPVIRSYLAAAAAVPPASTAALGTSSAGREPEHRSALERVSMHMHRLELSTGIALFWFKALAREELHRQPGMDLRSKQ